MTKSSREMRRHTKSEYSIRKSEGAIGRRRTHLPLLPVNQIKNILGTQWPAYTVPHSIKNAFVLTHQEKKMNPTHNKSINLSCHIPDKKHCGLKTLRDQLFGFGSR